MNHLKDAISPYLLQHRNDPVDWYPWCEEAFHLARQRNVPIFLSIGYASCHWCHVMAQESFRDPVTASYLNQHYVSIKVDREERPDIDNIYMDALLKITGQGGWPMSMFLKSDGIPFFGGTYFPKNEAYGMISFTQLLQHIHQVWTEEFATIETMSRALKQAQEQVEKSNVSTKGINLKGELEVAHRLIDITNGGLKGAPKFPQIPLLRWFYALQALTHDKILMDFLKRSALALCRGGIYDHVGGGWMRYVTDLNWLIPHFEKMLYDNALIIQFLSELYQSDPNPLYHHRVAATIEWLQREMQQQDGLFCASLSADSEGQEGKFYVWSTSEIKEILASEADLFCQQYDVTSQGNWEGVNILHQQHAGFNTLHEKALENALFKLAQHRKTRIKPARDDKVLLDWNALLVTALIKASFVFQEPLWFELAVDTFKRLEDLFCRDKQFFHSYRNGVLGQSGFLEDYAFMIDAAIRLHCHTGSSSYLEKAILWEQWTEIKFNPDKNIYFSQADYARHELYLHYYKTSDQATPAGNGVMALNFVNLYWLTNDAIYLEKEKRILQQLGQKQAIYASNLYLAALQLEEGAFITFDFSALNDKITQVLTQHNPCLTLLCNQLGAPWMTICWHGRCERLR